MLHPTKTHNPTALAGTYHSLRSGMMSSKYDRLSPPLLTENFYIVFGGGAGRTSSPRLDK